MEYVRIWIKKRKKIDSANGRGIMPSESMRKRHRGYGENNNTNEYFVLC